MGSTDFTFLASSFGICTMSVSRGFDKNLLAMPDSVDASARLIIDLKALAANYDALCKATNASVAGVVKANAYGLGLHVVAKVLDTLGCKTFFTAFAGEGAALRAVLPAAEIYVLSPLIEHDISLLMEHSLKPCLFDIDEIRQFIGRSEAQGQSPRAALHVDTGINRLGLDRNGLNTFCDSAAKGKLEVDLLMSHLACADEPDAALNRLQLERFQGIRRRFPNTRASLANSAGIFLGRDYHFDLVRPGIALFGHDPHYRVTSARVQPVATLQARLGQVKTVSAGDCIGYGATVRCDESKRIGVVLAGYADGIPRRLSDPVDGVTQAVGIAGHRAPLFGRVSMDLLTIDLSGFVGDTISPGDRVEIFGRNVPIEEVAEQTGTIPYELLTQIGSRVLRTYTE